MKMTSNMKTTSKMKTTFKWRWPQNKDGLKTEDNLNMKMTWIWRWPKYEDDQTWRRPEYEELKLTKIWFRRPYPVLAYTLHNLSCACLKTFLKHKIPLSGLSTLNFGWGLFIFIFFIFNLQFIIFNFYFRFLFFVFYFSFFIINFFSFFVAYC